MKRLSGPGHFRSDSTQSLTQSVMTLHAHHRPAPDASASQVISIVIHERLPFMNGLSGCEAEILLTTEQASRFAHTLIEMVGRAEAAHSADDIHALPSLA